MIVDLNALRRKESLLRITAKFTEEQLQIRSPLASLSGAARTKLRVSLNGDRVVVKGSVEAKLEVTCCRCTKRFPQAVEKDFLVEYWPDPQVSREGEELELSYADLVIGFYRDDQIDLSAVVSEQILLEIPMKAICRDSCKGLCDQCGADLNEVSCGCVKERIDPRLAALAQIKNKLIHRVK